jgi:tripartite-type tricarboxylate transporter receptor subunit TctC
MESSHLVSRTILAVTAAACVLVAEVNAQTNTFSYPSQLVRLIVPFSAGSTTDLIGRAVVERFSQLWQQPVIIENRSGIAGIASVAKARPDGHTILLTSNGLSIMDKINANLSFEPIRDLVGVSQVASMPLVLIVPSDTPVRSLADLLKVAQASPGKLSYASAGLGSTTNIASELLKKIAGIDVLHVPYRGAPEALTSVMRGDTQMCFTAVGVAVDLIETRKVRALAVSGPTRFLGLPDVPTFAEAGLPEFVYDSWFGLFVPAEVPPLVLKKISQDAGTVLKTREVQDLLARQGVTAAYSTPEQFTKVMKEDAARFADLFAPSR